MVQARVALARGDVDGAANCSAQARNFVAAHSMKHLSPAVMLLDGDVSLARQALSHACDLYLRAAELAESMGLRPVIRQAWAQAAHVARLRNDPQSGEGWQHRADEVRAEMAALFDDPELRDNSRPRTPPRQCYDIILCQIETLLA